MESKEIYNNGSSKCWVEFDGDIITISQWKDGEKVHSVYLYQDELVNIVNFVKSEFQ